MVFAGTPSATTSVHEWGHLRGLYHRADPTNPSANPGWDTYAIMKDFYDPLRRRINRFERQTLNGP
jgi:hypothetical protein